jgi:hypothetical protein
MSDLQYQAEVASAALSVIERNRIFCYRNRIGTEPLPDGRKWPCGPFSYQETFHRSPKRNKWMIAGNRTGKTRCGAAEQLMIALNMHPWYYCYCPDPEPVDFGCAKCGRRNKLPLGKIWNHYAVATSHKKSVEIQRSLVRWLLPPSYIEDWLMERAEKPSTLYLKDPDTNQRIGIINFMSYDQSAMEFESSSLVSVHCDEEPTEEIYDALQIRLLDTRGTFICTMTPYIEEGVGGVSWSYDRIFHNEDNDPELYVSDPIPMKSNPTLSVEEIDRLMRNTRDPEERECRFFGKYMNRSGRVFKTFTEQIFNPDVPAESGHLLPSEFLWKIPASWNRVMFIDPSNASAVGTTGCVWIAIAPGGELEGIQFKPGDLIFFKEYKEKDRAVKEHCAAIIAATGSLLVDQKYMDGRFGPQNANADAVEGETYQQLYQKHGLRCALWDASTYAVEIDAMKMYLNGTLDRTSRDPGVFFLDNLLESRQEIRSYQHPLVMAGPMRGERATIGRRHKQKGICLLDCIKAACNLRLKPFTRHYQTASPLNQWYKENASIAGY